MTRQGSARLAELTELTRTLNLHTPPSYFSSTVGVATYENAIEPILAGQDDRPLNLYIGVPLCAERCRFCMYFYGLADQRGEQAGACVDGIERFLGHIGAVAPGRVIAASYVGGGTPTVLSANQIERMLRAVNGAFVFEPAAQRTFEMSPGTATAGKIAAIVAGGFDRLSFGIQSYDPAIVRATGRGFTSPADTASLIETCQRAGVSDINIDLMVGLCGETDVSVADSVATALTTGCTTISIYRYRPAHKTELTDRGGLDRYVRNCAGRIETALRHADRYGWQVRGRLDGEHVRLVQDAEPVRPERNLYETRFRPRLGNSLLGVGSGARSFLWDQRLVHCDHSQRKGFRLLGRQVEVEECDTRSRVAAALVNELFREWTVDLATVAECAGGAPDDLFASELDYLVGQGVLERDRDRLTVAEEHRSEWTYFEKMLYPPRWIERLPGSARLRVR